MDSDHGLSGLQLGSRMGQFPLRTRCFVLSAAVFFLVAACAPRPTNGEELQGNTIGVPQSLDQSTSEPPRPPTTIDSQDPVLKSLVGPRWDLLEVNDSSVGISPDGRNFSIEFYGDSTYSLFDGCNPHSGKYSIDGSVISFSDRAIGGMACPSPDESTQTVQDAILGFEQDGLSVEELSGAVLEGRTVNSAATQLGFRANRTGVTSSSGPS